MSNPNSFNSKWEDLSWFDRGEVIRALSMFPAITVMVFIRFKIGFRHLKPIWLSVMALILLLLPEAVPDAAKPSRVPIFVFAIAMFALGHFQRWLRWRELCRGELWHTKSPGISYLEALPLPPYLRSHRRVNRYLDPLLVVLIGFAVGYWTNGLGIWIIFSGFFLFFYEQKIFEMQLESDLDTLDGMVISEAQGALAKYFDTPQAKAVTPSIEKTGGVPTGLSPDLAKQIELRKAKRIALPAAPDNLLTGSS